jgi:integrase
VRPTRPVSADGPQYATRVNLYTEMLAGWQASLIGGGVTEHSVEQMLRTVEAVSASFGGAFPWDWTKEQIDQWSASLVLRLALTTVRQYQGHARGFLDYLTDPGYDWMDRCEAECDGRIRQLFTRRNTVPHAWIYEGEPNRRPFTELELGTTFTGLLDHRLAVRRAHRKGGLADLRDYAWLAVILAWGLRENESRLLRISDFSEQADMEMKRLYGRFGVLKVRHGKAKRRGQARRRDVLTVPLWDFAVDVVKWYIEVVRPQFPQLPANRDALFLTERGSIPRIGYFGTRLKKMRERFDLAPELTTHCLRHTYITSLLENNYPAPFVQEQVGHEDPSQLATYTTLGNDFMREQILELLGRAAQRPALLPA